MRQKKDHHNPKMGIDKKTSRINQKRISHETLGTMPRVFHMHEKGTPFGVPLPRLKAKLRPDPPWRSRYDVNHRKGLFLKDTESHFKHFVPHGVFACPLYCLRDPSLAQYGFCIWIAVVPGNDRIEKSP
jgi:hypothetical protein